MTCSGCLAFDADERAAIEGRPIAASSKRCSCDVEPSVALTLWPSLAARGRRLEMTWEELRAWIGRPVIADAKDAHGGYSLATFRADVRKLANVERVAALGLDVDHGDARVARVLLVLRRYRAIGYTTHSHTADAPRCRVVIALTRPVTAAEYARLWDHVAAHLLAADVKVDRAARDASRLWYVPAVRANAPFVSASQTGEALDVDRVLAVDDEHQAEMAHERERVRIGVAPNVDRVRRYIATIEGAVSGQRGHDATFRVACIIVGNVADEAEQAALMREFNARCAPRWSEHELAHKLASARTRTDLRPL